MRNHPHVNAIIFSYNRPAQLDLLLRSIELNHPELRPVVLYRHDVSDTYQQAYRSVFAAHPHTAHVEEGWFKEQLEMLLAGIGTSVMLLCDDDVVYRRMTLPWRYFTSHEVFSFTYRLGLNTTYCYPLDQQQSIPEFIQQGLFHYWRWDTAEYDFGYPGSIDGGVFRAQQLLEMVRPLPYFNPNTFEDAIMQRCKQYNLPVLACYQQSCVVGMPLNIVNVSHPNRHVGETSPLELNERYLAGEQISLDTIDADKVNAAHTPFELKWEKR